VSKTQGMLCKVAVVACLEVMQGLEKTRKISTNEVCVRIETRTEFRIEKDYSDTSANE